MHTFQMGGNRLETIAKVYDLTPKDGIQAVSTTHKYDVKLYNASNPNISSAGARLAVPDLPIFGSYAGFDDNHKAIGVISQSGIYPFYTSFALKYQMLEYSGWWIFKSWGKVGADALTIQAGRLAVRGSEGQQGFDNSGLEDRSCVPCSSGEARAYAGSVNWSFAGGSIDVVQGVFDVTWNGTSYRRIVF